MIICTYAQRQIERFTLDEPVYKYRLLPANRSRPESQTSFSRIGYPEIERRRRCVLCDDAAAAAVMLAYRGSSGN